MLRLLLFLIIVITCLADNLISDEGNVNEERKQTKQLIPSIFTKVQITSDDNYNKITPIPLKPSISTIQIDTHARKPRMSCGSCEFLADSVINYYSSGVSLYLLKLIVIQTCVLEFNYDRSVCKGVVELNAPILIYILKKKPSLTGEQFCRIINQANCLSSVRDVSAIQPNKYVPLIFPKRLQRLKTIKPLTIVHFTDIHYDPDYIPGSNAQCNNPLCCRKGSDWVFNEQSAAGYWGDYRSCDFPSHSIDNAFEHVKDHYPDASLILYTGDTVAHNVWDTTFDQVKNSIDLITRKMKIYFKNIPIFPILGNHDTQPVNQFAPKDLENTPFNSSWIYQFVANKWKSWLPEQAFNSLREYGYYYVDPYPNLRIIGLNTNVCYIMNWWLQLDDTFFYPQLVWLRDQLLEAEQSGLSVWILSHIPPGSADCYIKWQQMYQKIKTRFAKIIRAEFVGHTHTDEVKLTYDLKSQPDPIGVVYNGGSLTTFENVNPNYRIYYADPNTFEILNYDQWVYNLSSANENPNTKPEWYKLYSFKEAYDLESASPPNLKDLISGLANDQQLVKQYQRFKVKDSDYGPLKDCNDEECKRETICRIVTTVFDDKTTCDIIFEKYSNAIGNNYFIKNPI